MLAFNAARIRRFPETKMKGITGLPPLAVFASDQAHYCAKKNSTVLGYGQDNCIGVKCDSRGKIIPEELEKAIVTAKEGVSSFNVISVLHQIQFVNHFFASVQNKYSRVRFIRHRNCDRPKHVGYAKYRIKRTINLYMG